MLVSNRSIPPKAARECTSIHPADGHPASLDDSTLASESTLQPRMAVEDKSLPAAGDDALSPPPLQPLQQLDGAGHGGGSGYGSGNGNGNGNGGETEVPISGLSSAKQATSLSVSRYLKEKEQEWKAVSERIRPLTLLELPVDILSLVVKEASFMTHSPLPFPGPLCALAAFIVAFLSFFASRSFLPLPPWSTMLAEQRR